MQAIQFPAALSSRASDVRKTSLDTACKNTSAIRQENPLDAGDWDARLSKFAATSIFHSSAWAKVLSETYGFTPVYLSTFRGDDLDAALPLMEVKSRITGTRGVSLPFTDECEPVSASDSSVTPLVEEALQLGRNRNWKYVEFRGGKNLFDNAAPSLSFFGHQLNLSGDANSLFNRLESSVRRAIRKAENSGLKIEFSNTLEATSDYFSLHCKTRRQHGIPPQPFRFFQKIHAHILAQNSGVIVTAKFQETPVASAMFLFSGTKAIYKFGASDKSFQELRANNLVMWEGIKWLANKGIGTLRFGRTSQNSEGLRRYKLGWGSEEYLIHYYKFDLRRNALVTDRDEAAGWHNRIFRAMPIFMSRWAGNLLYRHVA
jgi:hypothetical protein